MNVKITASILCVLFWSGIVSAATDTWSTKVTQFLVDDSQFGGCLAFLSVPPSSRSAISCPSGWVSFDCTGTVNSKSEGSIKLGAAQLAFVTDKCIIVTANDAVTFNGQCHAPTVNLTSSSSC